MKEKKRGSKKKKKMKMKQKCEKDQVYNDEKKNIF